MGFFNNIFGSRQSRDEEILYNQREQQRTQEQFRNEVLRKERQHQKETKELKDIIFQLQEQMRALKNEQRNLKRSRDASDKIKLQENKIKEEVTKKQLQKKEKEEQELKNRNKISEKEYLEAKEITEKIKKQLEKHIEHKNSFEIEKIEKKLKDNIIIFKNRFVNDRNTSMKELEIVKEIIYNIANYYYNSGEYEKALNLFLEYKEFNTSEDERDVEKKIIDSSFECGKYKDVEKYLENYQEKEKEKEYISKLAFYLKLDKDEEIEKYIEKTEKLFLNDTSNISKLYWEKYSELLEEYCLNRKNNKKFISYLFFVLLYRRKFSKIKELLMKFDSFEEKEFFEGILDLKNNENRLAAKKIEKYKETLYGKLYYLEAIKNDLNENNMNDLNEFLKIKFEEVDKKIFFTDFIHIQNKKYEFLSAKLEYVRINKKEKLSDTLDEITNILEEDVRVKQERGKASLWIALIESKEYLEKLSSPLTGKINSILQKYLSEDEIEKLKDGLEELPEIDILEEYTMLDLKNNISWYKDIRCKNNLTGDFKIYIELTETMNKNKKTEKQVALSNDQKLGKNSENFLRIDNFYLEDNKIQIITEDYEELYEEFKNKYTVMPYEEKLKEANRLIEAFKKLEVEKIFFNRFNPDNLVISDGKYKFRFLNYIKTNSNGSLSSTNSSLSKKSSLYQSPEYIEKNIGKESNIYILGLMLYEIFYGYHIITGIIDSSLSLENKEKVREAFYFEKDIDKSIVKYISSDRLWEENKEKNTVKIRKIQPMYYVPEGVSDLIKEILSITKSERPSLEEISEKLEDIKYDTKNYEGYIPNNFKREDLEKVINSLKASIKRAIIRDTSLQKIFSNIKFDEKAPALIVLKMNDDRVFEISEIGEFYTLVERKKKNELNVSKEEIKEKIEKLLQEKDYKEFSEKNKISETKSEEFLYGVREILDKYFENGVMELDNEREYFEEVLGKTEEVSQLFATSDSIILFKILEKLLY